MNCAVISLLFAVFSSYSGIMLCENISMMTQTPIPTAVPAVREHFAKRLKELRIPRGFPTARSLSRALGIDENRYTRYERAEVEPDLSLLIKICALLRASPNDLLIPSGFDDSQRAYTTEPTTELTSSKPNGLSHTPPATDPLRRRAIAWQLASELVGCGAVAINSAAAAAPMARLQLTNSLSAELDSDAFGTIGRILDDARMKTVAAPAVEKITGLVDELIAAIAADGGSRA